MGPYDRWKLDDGQGGGDGSPPEHFCTACGRALYEPDIWWSDPARGEGEPEPYCNLQCYRDKRTDRLLAAIERAKLLTWEWKGVDDE